jgi:soluble lytic murein transglycosylase-like protein
MELHAPVIDAVAHEVDVPAELLHAVISVESAYAVDAVSAKGAKGLMQLMPATARRFGVVDPLEPRSNVRGGALYLKWLIQRFNGDMELVLAAYNAGEEAVIRAGYRVPQISETLSYVPRVLARLQTARAS